MMRSTGRRKQNEYCSRINSQILHYCRIFDVGDIIHKQIWAVEHPDKFYEGNVDYGWQKTQLEAEKIKQ